MSSCCYFSCVQLFATLWTVAHQTPLFMGFSRQEYWSGLPSPPPGDLPDPGIKPASLMLAAGSLPTEPPGKSFSRPPGSVSEQQGVVAAALHSTASMAMLDFTENCDPCSPSTGSTFDYSHHVTRMMCSIS